MELSRHRLRMVLYQNRLEICDFKIMSEEILRDYCEIFKESTQFIYEYHRAHNQEDSNIDEYYFGLAMYHNYLGLLDYAHERIQDTIINYETAFSYMEQQREILELKLSNHQTSHLFSRLENTYLFIGDLFQRLGEIQCSDGILQDGRTYLTQSMEIFSELFGTHSLKYVTVFCQIAFSYQVENRDLYVKMISDLYDSLECSENKESLLHISIVKFLVFSDQSKDVMSLHSNILPLLEEKVVMHNTRLLLQFHLLSIAITSEASQELSLQHARNAFDIIRKQDDLARSLNLIELIVVVAQYMSDNHIYYLLLLNESLTLLKNQQYRIEIFNDKRIEDYELQINLLRIEHQIIRIQLMLFMYMDSNIDEIFCQIQKMMNHFNRIPQLRVDLINVIGEFSFLMYILKFKDLSHQLIEQLTDMSKLIEDENTAKQIHMGIQLLLSRMSQN